MDEGGREDKSDSFLCVKIGSEPEQNVAPVEVGVVGSVSDSECSLMSDKCSKTRKTVPNRQGELQAKIHRNI